MRTVSGYILTTVLGWKITGEFPQLKKSVVIFAPHTSYYDAFYGKLFLNEIVVKYIILSKKELFFFPMNILMKWYGSVAVGVKGENAINKIAKILQESQSAHIILSPEGSRKKVIKWNKGFYYMASKAKVPIVVIYLDYKKKEIGIKGVIENLENVNAVMNQVNTMYKDISAMYPDKFSIDQSTNI